MAILVHNSAQNYNKLNSDRTKEFNFRMSVYNKYNLETGKPKKGDTNKTGNNQ